MMRTAGVATMAVIGSPVPPVAAYAQGDEGRVGLEEGFDTAKG